MKTRSSPSNQLGSINIDSPPCHFYWIEATVTQVSIRSLEDKVPL